MNYKAPIFIGGTGRSGTSILIRLLAQHPEIFAIRWESQFLVANNGLIDLVTTIGNKEQKFKKFKHRMETHWYKRVVNKGKPNEYNAGLVVDVSRENLDRFYTHLENRIQKKIDLSEPKFIRELLNILFSEKQKKEGAIRFCEKTPSNVLYMLELQKIYPNMKFINIIRDGRDVISSIVNKKIWPVGANAKFPQTLEFKGEQKPLLVAKYWKTIMEISDQLSSMLPEENYLEIRLEDLVYQKETIIKKLMDFLGHDIVPELLDFKLDDSSFGRWQTDKQIMDNIDEINTIISSMMEQKNYFLKS